MTSSRALGYLMDEPPNFRANPVFNIFAVSFGVLHVMASLDGRSNAAFAYIYMLLFLPEHAPV